MRIFSTPEDKGISLEPLANYVPRYFNGTTGFNLSYVVEYYLDQTNGNFYRVWDNGVIEQGGIVDYTASTSVLTFNLFKPYTTDTSYMIIGCSATSARVWQAEANFRLLRVNRTSFAIQDGNNQPNAAAFWYAIGR